MTPQLNSIGLIVADMAATLAFYRHLGMDVPAEADREAHVEVTVTGGLRLTFDTVDIIHMYDPGWAPPTGGHRVALAFRCADGAEVDRGYASLVGAGYAGHRPPWDAFWGQRYAIVHDPDGTAVELFAPLE
jgi:catechol 2,3-dioxygenase-like lactoylglutathione lyase family enzyme